MESLQPGDPERIGDYMLLARLGAGGMGQVFLGRSPAGRNVAIKVVHEAFAGEQDFRARFRHEVAAARAVSGAFTAPVIDADPEAPAPWLVTTFLPGLSLDDAVDTYGSFPVPAVRALGASLAEALVSIHKAGVVHRDLKPSNVLLTAEGPRVIDFGIARAAEASAVTQTGFAVGSPGFMAPEQATGDEIGPASDVFSLGAVLTFVATGTGPYGDAAIHALIYRILHEPPRLDGVTDPELRSFLASCLARDPAGRPTAEAVRDLLSAGSAPAHGIAWLPAAPAEEIARRTAQAPPPGAPPLRPAPPAPPPPPPMSGPYGPGPPAPGPYAAVPYAPGSHAPGPWQGQGAVPGAGQGPWQGPVPGQWPGPAPGQWPGQTPGQWSGPTVPGTARPGRRAFLAAAVGAAGLAVAGGAGFVLLRSRSDGPIIWHAKLPGIPGDGPVVDGGQVYASVSAGGLHAIDARTGRLRWESPVNTGVTELVLTMADGVGFSQARGSLEAFDLSSGKRLWGKSLEGNISIPKAAAGSGLVYAAGRPDRTVFDYSVVAFDARTGAERWRRTAEGRMEGNPTLSGGVVYAGSTQDGIVYAIGALDGSLRWRQKVGGERNGPVSTPVVSGGVVYVTTEQFLVCALDAATGRVRWQRQVGGDANRGGAMPLVVGNTVYVGGGNDTLFALDTAEGRLRWSYHTGKPSDGIGNTLNPAWLTPTVAGNTLLLYDGKKELHGVDATTGRVRWRLNANAHTREKAVLTGRTAHMATLDGILSIDAQSGKRVRLFEDEDELVFMTSTISAVNGVLYFAESSAGIYALRPP